MGTGVLGGLLARFRDVYVESSNLSLFCDKTDSFSNGENFCLS